MRTLQRLEISSFKSIREQTLSLGQLNVFIGGNGSGKSNLIQVFRFLREIVNQNLRGYVQTKGGADTLLHFGRKQSPEGIAFELEFGEGEITNGYRVYLAPTDEGTLIIRRELALYHEKNKYTQPYDYPVASQSVESKLRDQTHMCPAGILADLENYRVYHFHDTSETAEVKGLCDIDDNAHLRPQAENLAAFLYWLEQKRPQHFNLIEDTIRQIAPFFDKFRLRPSKLNEGKIRLEWTEKGSDAYFNAHSLSDGTLRFICLVTLLLQPELPSLVLLDEPELGLHPAAISLLSELLSSAANKTQVIAATQSVTLVNHLEPEMVWAVDRQDNQSVFKNLGDVDHSAWLDNYALGELWEKNIVGARP